MSTYRCVVCTHPMDEVDPYMHICVRCRRTEYTWHEYTWHDAEEMDQG